MTLTAEKGAKIDTWVYVLNDKREQSILGECDTVCLGTVKLDLKTSKSFRSYGTMYHLLIKGKARVTLTTEKGAKIDTWVYVLNNKSEQLLPGEYDAVCLGIVKLDLKGSTEEVMGRVSYLPKPIYLSMVLLSGNEKQEEIDKKMKALINKFPSVFIDVTETISR